MNSVALTFAAALIGDETAVTAVEYGLMASLIALALVVGLGATGASIAALFDNLAVAFAAAL